MKIFKERPCYTYAQNAANDPVYHPHSNKHICLSALLRRDKEVR